ncbi:MAG: M48 family metalloprotease [Thermodesulfobacteriota bacterium]
MATRPRPLSATLPTLLIESKFSKEFEVEADDYSYNYLKKTGIPTIHFANIMERMSKARGGEQTKLNYLSSHPSTADRIERFKDN